MTARKIECGLSRSQDSLNDNDSTQRLPCQWRPQANSTLCSLWLFPPPKSLGTRYKAISYDGHQLKTASQATVCPVAIRTVWFFTSADINLLLLIATCLSSSGLPHYMPCMTLVLLDADLVLLGGMSQFTYSNPQFYPIAWAYHFLLN